MTTTKKKIGLDRYIIFNGLPFGGASLVPILKVFRVVLHVGEVQAVGGRHRRPQRPDVPRLQDRRDVLQANLPTTHRLSRPTMSLTW